MRKKCRLETSLRNCNSVGERDVHVGEAVDLELDASAKSSFFQGFRRRHRVRAVVRSIEKVKDGHRITVEAPAGKPARARTRRLAIFLVGILLTGGIALYVAWPKAATKIVGPAGPWGRIEYTPIEIEPPDEWILRSTPPALRWFFEGKSQKDVLAFFHDADLSEAAAGVYANQGRWEAAVGGTWLEPPADAVLALDAGSRRKIYNLLSQSTRNLEQRYPIAIHRELADREFAASGLGMPTIGDFRRTLCERGSWLLFSDYATLWTHLSDPQERSRLTAMVMKSATYQVRLKLDSGSDIAGIVRYWSRGNTRASTLEPFIEALTRVPSGSDFALFQILPVFARRRLYTYPAPAEAEADCNWSSLNFLNEMPDRRFHDPKCVAQTLDAEYETVQGAPRFGDLVLLIDHANGLKHSAVYLADDLFFTKNGAGERVPWIYMKKDEMIELYNIIADEPLRVVFTRRKGGSEESR